MKIKTRQRIDGLILIFLFATVMSSHLMVSSLFLDAYNNPDKTTNTLISIDKYGEANLEIVLIVLSYIAVVYVGCNVMHISITGKSVLSRFVENDR